MQREGKTSWNETKGVRRRRREARDQQEHLDMEQPLVGSNGSFVLWEMQAGKELWDDNGAKDLWQIHSAERLEILQKHLLDAPAAQGG